MKTKLIVVAALATAMIGPLAALAAPGADVTIAIERAAPEPLIALEAAHAAQPIGAPLAAGGKLDLASPAMPAAGVQSWTPGPVAAAWCSATRASVAYHLRL